MDKQVPQEKKKENKEEQFDENVEEQKTVKSKSAKEMKQIVRPTFRANPEKYYPTKVFNKYGFTRNLCKCGNYYWRRSEARTTCGDSNCVGSYTFIGKGCGIGLKGKKVTYAEAWKQYERSFNNARIPCHSNKRYPVVARWRNDVDYVAAGIYTYQPYCVTGEMDPPFNPVICPQFCVRFNDLDNIGLTQRHFSGFVMLGCHVFNYPNKFIFFDEECVEFHIEWLKNEVQIDLDEVTLIEDVWCGGGNLGPSIEMFAHGLEIGNMVFIRYKYFPDGSFEELAIKVIDVGVGLERIPWLINGSPTIYNDIFPNTIQFLSKVLEVDMSVEVWKKIGPYTCLLNIDETDNIEKQWQIISSKVNMSVEEIKKQIIPVKDLYILCDHARTAMMVICDGSLPSNVGGGSNIRNIIRRMFSILKKNNWWEKFKDIKGFLQIFDYEKKDINELYGEFPEYKSFDEIITMEYERWKTTDINQRQKLEKIIKKNKDKKGSGILTIDDWILGITTYGIPADTISEISGLPIPGNLYYEIAYRQEISAKVAETILYQTSHIPETDSLYFKDHKQSEFEGTILDIFANVQKNNVLDIVILDKSAFYPLSGGQQNDIGEMVIEGVTYKVIAVDKIGKCVLHFLDKPLSAEKGKQHYINMKVKGIVDMERRKILKRHHTGTHIVFASCRKVLGPHVWQHGAKKTVDQAHLDISHFKSLTAQEELAIEKEANNLILANKKVSKDWQDKALAEKQFGFRLYQGGVVPGNKLRVVNIEDTDVEACCGTHCDFTSEVGFIKILKTVRIQDGIVRLYYVAGEKAIEKVNYESQIIKDINKLWGVSTSNLQQTAEDFFERTKKAEREVDEQRKQILTLRMNLFFSQQKEQKHLYYTMEEEATLYHSFLNNYIEQMKEQKKGVLFIGKLKSNQTRFIFGQFGDANMFDMEGFKKILALDNQKCEFKKLVNKIDVKGEGKDKKKQKGKSIEGILQFCFMGTVNLEKLMPFFKQQQIIEQEN